jgi:hypothetical protein
MKPINNEEIAIQRDTPLLTLSARLDRSLAWRQGDSVRYLLVEAWIGHKDPAGRNGSSDRPTAEIERAVRPLTADPVLFNRPGWKPALWGRLPPYQRPPGGITKASRHPALPEPVLDHEPIDPGKFQLVAGNQDISKRQNLCGDQPIDRSCPSSPARTIP